MPIEAKLQQLEAAMTVAFGDRLLRVRDEEPGTNLIQFFERKDVFLSQDQRKFLMWAIKFERYLRTPLEGVYYIHPLLSVAPANIDNAIDLYDYFLNEPYGDNSLVTCLDDLLDGDAWLFSTKAEVDTVYFMILGGEEEKIFSDVENMMDFFIEAFRLKLYEVAFQRDIASILSFRPLHTFAAQRNPTMDYWRNNPPTWSWDGPL